MLETIKIIEFLHGEKDKLFAAKKSILIIILLLISAGTWLSQMYYSKEIHELQSSISNLQSNIGLKESQINVCNQEKEKLEKAKASVETPAFISSNIPTLIRYAGRDSIFRVKDADCKTIDLVKDSGTRGNFDIECSKQQK